MHEKNVRHGHISTLHVWPARRPLAASRAVLLATLLDDPGSDGRVGTCCGESAASAVKKETERGEKEETIGGVLHWGRESSPELTRLRETRFARRSEGGRPGCSTPSRGAVPFPLEAMRLGCEVTASDHQPRRVVHPAMHPALPTSHGRKDPPAPGLSPCGTGDFVEAFPQGAGDQEEERPAGRTLARLGHGDGATGATDLLRR